MRRPIAFAVSILAALALAACDKPATFYQGWVEADIIYVGPDEAGRVETLSVKEGDTVARGADLFTLDADLQKADLGIAEAALANAKRAFERADDLLRTKTGSQKNFDDAQAQLRDTTARLDAAQTRLVRRKVSSPVDGTVQQLYFRVGELVAAGRPVVAILPPGNLKVRFFLPQTEIARIALGDKVQVACDGCVAGISAKVSFISRSVEFTPPVIYSLEERAKLVFMVEAVPDQPDKLRVGQPIQVRTAAMAGRETRR
ncbi:HlyD family secretion protein [Blastochloris tepida]|uniref:Hemolysin D n=1 Tax=Blastochloris tepida TaxID=2233851 RepID=A0A348FX72_9HYPH|nr:efflux RND transporter periplasmic adaptor subunit [Blastochloris tepida]BBF91905.1 hemolysin D [Blastochloris tepida]